ncbi:MULTISPECIES: N-6 DNA methylase [unclassified Streptomyces]|uniref:N-6 DNA methylase n=1 Tax=unclassified Streptomyces TaxID=2593676 RepID=UPI0006FD3096|nr:MULTISPECIES: N-6 DNA methylase [unclassified Streptomyces]KQX55363.1 N-6 DNA methylase [Streptomyces sp. Root1304]KRA95271.1 N-6 DNA methylase [Streptomyces sp. Root66D1]
MRDDAGAVDPLITGAEIARIAGVTRAAVSNWRRRHKDFPAPAGGSSGTPLFSLTDVRAWLATQRKSHDVSDEVRLWQALRASFGDDMISGLSSVAAFLSTGNPSGLDSAAAAIVASSAQSATPTDVADGLVERFQDSARRSGSDQVTSARIARAVAHFVGPLPKGTTVFDPACGIGVLLMVAGDDGSTVIRGQEIDPAAARFAELRAKLSGRADAVIQAGDSLRADAWPSLRADLVVCEPPAVGPDWGREELLLDARWELGTPSKAEGELAWLQHCYAHTAPGGRTVIVMPSSVAYRKAGRRIRAELVRRGILAHVIALPGGVASSHSVPVLLWILRRPKPDDTTPSHVRMVDLTGNDPDGPLEPTSDQVADIPLIDLLDETVDLTPNLHIHRSTQDFRAEYWSLREEIEQQLQALGALLPALRETAGEDSLDTATVSLADLSRAGLIEAGAGGPQSLSPQLDTDYLRGFLQSASNVRRSTSTSGTHRVDARAARIPQMAVADQRRYGAVFRSLQEFEERVASLAELGKEAAALAREGLTNGALAPPADDSGE